MADEFLEQQVPPEEEFKIERQNRDNLSSNNRDSSSAGAGINKILSTNSSQKNKILIVDDNAFCLIGTVSLL